MTDETEQWRVEFDAEVAFRNGGSLSVEGFRLDSPTPDLDDAATGELLVRHLGLLMVGEVRVSNRRMIAEAHKGSRGVETARTATSRLVELSHPVEHGMETLPGVPGPVLGDYLTREQSRSVYGPETEFHIGTISMVANTGTYVDSPAHRFDGEPDLARLPLERVADLDGIVVRVAGDGQRAVDKAALLPFDVAGRAVLIHTGWDRNWRTPAYFDGHPYLTADAADWLVEQGAALVGIDSLNIDSTDDPLRPAHTRLLRAGIPIAEHLRGLEQLPPSGFRFHAAPVPVIGLGTFPVRAYAVI
ncbi:Kynurenine formamidase [Actinokineospora alba]|uniref:Kynurenine formamidase n=1 Tax=Actinokineospora alba TaxID=504798 RepID=A0A1H0GEM1_9PSEU|nr:cyclase family protein [Actinokineospora alba]TDP69865.1 kynurenine formamidase [Actinokineospora alba]SDI07067.1 Kynurenine formamidase [Actinokineospora alba]SDO05323.1 Kynurenine formamidase [Actinokineospora alba]